MGVEENLKIVEEWAEAISARDLDRVLEMYADSIVSHDPSLPEPVKGIEAHKAWEMPIFEAFGDLKVTVLNSFGQGDWVVAEEVYEMTHTGPLVMPDGSEVPPTQRPRRVGSWRCLGSKGERSRRCTRTTTSSGLWPSSASFRRAS